MSRIFFAAQKLGGQVAGNEDGALISFGAQTLECRLIERLRKTKLPLKRFDLRHQTEQFRRGYRSGFEVTGILAFEIDTYLRGEVQQVWQETDEVELEKMLPEILRALASGALVRQAWEDEDAQAAALRAQEQALRVKAMREEHLEDRRWQFLVAEATKTNDVQAVAKYVREMIETGSQDPQLVVGDRTVGQWLEWLDLVLNKRGGQNGLAALFARIHAIDAGFED